MKTPPNAYRTCVKKDGYKSRHHRLSNALLFDVFHQDFFDDFDHRIVGSRECNFVFVKVLGDSAGQSVNSNYTSFGVVACTRFNIPLEEDAGGAVCSK